MLAQSASRQSVRETPTSRGNHTAMTTETAIEIRPAPGKWVVFALGGIFGESARALQLLEGDRDPVIYFPRDDIAMAFLDRTAHSTHCPHKGTATYYALDTKSEVIDNAAWSYEDPAAGAEAIRGYLAFDTDRVTVEQQSPS